MSAFPLSLPPPIDRILGKEVLDAEPWLLDGDVVHNVASFLRRKVTYFLVQEGDANVWVPPRQVLAEGRGNCEDVAVLSLSILSAAGVPGGLAFFYDPARGLGHTISYFKITSCCDRFVRVIEANASGVNEWEVDGADLSVFKETFDYPELEVVT